MCLLNIKQLNQKSEGFSVFNAALYNQESISQLFMLLIGGSISQRVLVMNACNQAQRSLANFLGVLNFFSDKDK